MADSWLLGTPEPLRRHYKLACALLDALPADVALTAAQVEAAATHLLKLGYRQRAFQVEENYRDLDPAQLRVEIFRNTAGSSVRITHLPTGLASQCGSEKTETENRTGALKMLRKLLEADRG